MEALGLHALCHSNQLVPAQKGILCWKTGTSFISVQVCLQRRTRAVGSSPGKGEVSATSRSGAGGRCLGQALESETLGLTLPCALGLGVSLAELFPRDINPPAARLVVKMKGGHFRCKSASEVLSRG